MHSRFDAPTIHSVHEHAGKGVMLDIALTARCPLRCRFCTVEKKSTPELSAVQWRNVVRAFARLRRVEWVSLEGGEPMLRTDLPEILADCMEAAGNVKIVTSGSVGIETLPRDLVCDPRLTLEVSVDGPKAAHDFLRDGSWDRAWEFVREAAAKGVRLRLRSVVSTWNIALIEEWLEGVDDALRAGPLPIGYRFDTIIAPRTLAGMGGPLERHGLRDYDCRGLLPSPEAVRGLYDRLTRRRFRRLRFEQTEAFRGCGTGRLPLVSFDPAGFFSFCCEVSRGFGSVLDVTAKECLRALDKERRMIACRDCRHLAQGRCDGCWTGTKCGMVLAWNTRDCRGLVETEGSAAPRPRPCPENAATAVTPTGRRTSGVGFDLRPHSM